MLDFSKIKIGIINLNINNLYSIYNAFRNIGFKTSIIEKKIDNFDFIVLPGIGSFKLGINSLKKNNLIDTLNEKILIKKKKIIGICLGMQLLFSKSYEYGLTKGLNFINGSVKKFKKKKIFIPVMGWYKTTSSIHTLNNKYFYHTHSYYCEPNNKKMVIAKTNYEKLSYCSAISSENILGFQFHPEKSGIIGLNLLKKIPSFFL